MKKSLIFSILLFFFFTSYSQVFVNGININDIKTNYCIITKRSIPSISVDYGQDKARKKAKISDKNGKIVNTKKIITLLNFMDENGWIIVNFSQTSLDSFNEGIFLFKKK